MLEEGERAPHPLMEDREVKRVLALVLSTDKGLCGALNTNLFREVAKLDPEKTDFVCVGKKGAQFLSRSRRSVIAEFDLKDSFSFHDAQIVSKFCLEQYIKGKADQIVVVYSDYVNTLTQIPSTRVVAPVHSFDVGPAEVEGRYVENSAPAAPPDVLEYVLEPNKEELLRHLLPHFVFFKIYHLVLESRASEHSARMVAMKNATDNAKQIIKDLTLEYNKIRQASITTEILEIATAQMVLS
jgi:F-type H+-transporting ATPase subunit gamma